MCGGQTGRQNEAGCSGTFTAGPLGDAEVNNAVHETPTLGSSPAPAIKSPSFNPGCILALSHFTRTLADVYSH